MNFIKLTEDKLNVGEISELVADSSCGAISMFVGTTRDNFEDKKVISLEYEAYDSMAIKIMNEICDKIRLKWEDTKNIAIYHRLENVPVKEASVVIAISSPHRQTSLEAVEFAINELKKAVPIWKKEKYDGHEAVWKENKECVQKNVDKENSKKRPKFDFEKNCKVNFTALPKNLIQIHADDNEIERRMKCFIDKKREEIDINNILDFTAINEFKPNSNTDIKLDELCARTNAVLFKSKNSKGHVRVQRVRNDMGPQDPKHYMKTLDKLMFNKNKLSSKEDLINKNIPKTVNNIKETQQQKMNGLEERCQNLENFLKLNKPCSNNMFERLKILEQKILTLESISPEYKMFMVKEDGVKAEIKDEKCEIIKRKFSVEDIDNYIEYIKSTLNSSENELSDD